MARPSSGGVVTRRTLDSALARERLGVFALDTVRAGWQAAAIGCEIAADDWCDILTGRPLDRILTFRGERSHAGVAGSGSVRATVSAHGRDLPGAKGAD